MGKSTIANSRNDAEKDKTASSSSQKPRANRSKNPKRKNVVEIPSESEEEENKATSGKNAPKNQNTASKVSHVKNQNNKWGNKNAQSTAKVNNKDKKNETKNVLIIGAAPEN